MNRAEIENLEVEGKKLTKEVVDSIFTMYGKAIQSKDEKIATLTTEKDGLSSQLSELNTKVKDLSSVDAKKLKEDIETLNKKYEADTQKLQKTISDQNYSFKVKELTNGIKFSSESAKKSFINDLVAKELKLEDDKILGFDDFVKTYKTTDPNAFIIDDGKPAITVSTGAGHEITPTNEATTLIGALKEKFTTK